MHSYIRTYISYIVIYYRCSVTIYFKVCKDSIQTNKDLTDSDFPVNCYIGEVNFDAGGIAKIICEEKPKNIVDVYYWPKEVHTV